MNAAQLAREAYGQTTANVAAPRTLEYDAFSRVSHRLRETANKRDTDFGAFVAALHDNRTLWRILATHVADEANGLPADLRARLFYLSEFTQAESRKVLRGDGDVEALIDINTAVMRGLRQQAETPEPVA